MVLRKTIFNFSLNKQIVFDVVTHCTQITAIANAITSISHILTMIHGTIFVQYVQHFSREINHLLT